jgi:hypothetical protein
MTYQTARRISATPGLPVAQYRQARTILREAEHRHAAYLTVAREHPEALDAVAAAAARYRTFVTT